MAIERPPLVSDNFTIIPKAQTRNPKLTLQEKGLLEYIASHAAGYELTIAQIIDENADSRTAVDNTIKSLARKGYLVRGERVRNANGTLGAYNWKLVDHPGVSAGGNQCTFPHTGETCTGADQGEQGVCAGGDQCTVPSAGERAHKEDHSKKTNKKTTKNITPPAADAAAAVDDGKKADDEKPERPEVLELCNQLADALVANGRPKRPTVTKVWRDECRRLMDLDKYDAKQIAYMIRWSQQHAFWSTVILSMPNLRRHFDRMKQQVMRDHVDSIKPTSGAGVAKSFQQREREHSAMASSVTQQAHDAWCAAHPGQKPGVVDLANILSAARAAALAVENTPANGVATSSPGMYGSDVIEGVAVETGARQAIGGAGA